MDKKISTLIIIAIVLIVGLYIFATEGDRGKDEEIVQEENFSEEPQQDTEVGVSEEETENEGEDEEGIDIDIAIGEEAPDFTLINLEGEEVSLSDYRGQHVLINFWATWCKYCDVEMPSLQRVDDENDDVVVLAIDVAEERELVEDYIEEGEYDFEVVLDEEADIAKTYLVSSFPTSYFVDKEGILIGGVPGMLTYAQMNQILDGIRENE